MAKKLTNSKKMTLSEAIATNKVSNIVAAVERAVKDYPIECPAPALVCSVGGMVPITLLDKESKLEVAQQALLDIQMKIEKLEDNGVRHIEIAKLVATNSFLRNIQMKQDGGGYV